MSIVTMKALLETGVHFGHRTRKWNPKMKPYIFTERNGIHILDLHQTLQAIKEAYDLVRDKVAEGGTLMFVGTKRQAQDTIAREATRSNMPYVSERWLGGTLTNWRTIRQRIDYLKGLEARRERGEFELLTKKEGLMLSRQIEKLNMRLGGIRDMRGLPALMFVVDVHREYTAVREAAALNIPVMAMVDTNSDPDMIDYVIPANDDAIRAIKLVAGVMADAVLEGMGLRKDEGQPQEEVAEEMPAGYDYSQDRGEEPEVADEEFLGEATLAKLKSGSLSFDDEESKLVEEEIPTEAEAMADAPAEEEMEVEADLEVESEMEAEAEAPSEVEAEVEAEAEAVEEAAPAEEQPEEG